MESGNFSILRNGNWDVSSLRNETKKISRFTDYKSEFILNILEFRNVIQEISGLYSVNRKNFRVT